MCKDCKIFKPRRTHHCRQCGTCILKMDHHCNWLVNCMGFNNYKFFVVGLMHAIVATLFCWTTYSECFFDVVGNKQRSVAVVIGVTLTWFMQLSIICIIGSFTFFHLTQLAGKGRTTIEFCEGNNNDDYSEGFCENLKIALGRNPLFWFFPFCANKEGQGTDYVPKNIPGE